MSSRGIHQRRARRQQSEEDGDDLVEIPFGRSSSMASNGTKKDRRALLNRVMSWKAVHRRSFLPSLLLLGGVLYGLLLLGGYNIVLMPTHGGRRPGHFSRIVHYAVDKTGRKNKKKSRYRKVTRLDPNVEIFPSKRDVDDPTLYNDADEWAPDSHDYEKYKATPLESDECKAQYPWMIGSFPTCNLLHEADVGTLFKPGTNETRARIVANGYYRDVWVMDDQDEPAHDLYVVKSMRIVKQKWTDRNFDRHRRDALAMERLTKSKYVVDIFGFCGNSGLFEYAAGGDIVDALWPKGRSERGTKNKEHSNKLSQIKKLHIATQAAMGLAAVHNVDREGRASIVHADISPGQYVYVEKDGIYKLNDFNRARFITWCHHNNTPCGFTVGSNPGKFRAPEEYEYEPETEKVDVYSLGNIFYLLLQYEWPFDDMSTKEAQKLVKKGIRPSIYDDIWNSTDPVDVVIKEAMFMAHEHDPTERASARKIETLLKKKLEELDPGRLAEWGDKKQ